MSAPFLAFHPAIPWRGLLTAQSSRLEGDLPGLPFFFEYSRDALHWAYGALLRARPSQTTAWMPSFHCGMEVRAVMDAGFSPRFYPVRIGSGGGIVADLDALEEGLRADPGPVMVIHYFGFPEPGIEAMRG